MKVNFNTNSQNQNFGMAIKFDENASKEFAKVSKFTKARLAKLAQKEANNPNDIRVSFDRNIFEDNYRHFLSEDVWTATDVESGFAVHKPQPLLSFKHPVLKAIEDVMKLRNLK